MIRIFLTSVAILTASPALAQSVTPADPAAGAATMAPASPADAAAATTPAGTSPTSPVSQVATVVETEFPAYDADKSGDLNKAEFARWVATLKAEELKTTGKTMAQAEVSKWAAGAFVTADADKNKIVSKAELTAYLGG